jgi:hypothetical protein
MEWKEKRKEEVGTLKVYGKQVMQPDGPKTQDRQ